MKALLTGASSFTGYWIADALLQRGVELVLPLRGAAGGGEPVRAERLRRLQRRCAVVPEAPLGSAALADLAAAEGPFDLVWLHAAEVGDFRDPRYHPLIATAASTAGVGTLLDASRCGRVIATGSVFEADEGKGGPGNGSPGSGGEREAIGAYGLAKTLAWQVIRHEAASRRLPLAKLVIAHPFGPLEKGGLTRSILAAWRRGEPAVLRHPWLFRDFLPVGSLADAAAGWATAPGAARHYCPSGFAESVGAFAERLARAVRPRHGLDCAIELRPEPTDEPGVRIGCDRLDVANVHFWDEYLNHEETIS